MGKLRVIIICNRSFYLTLIYVVLLFAIGVRTSTFPDLLIANKTGTLVHQWPMKTWGFNVDINLRDTGGFSTFAEDLELSSDQFDFGFCIDNTKSGDHTAANTACDENNPDIIPFQFVVQADNTASQT